MLIYKLISVEIIISKFFSNQFPEYLAPNQSIYKEFKLNNARFFGKDVCLGNNILSQYQRVCATSPKTAKRVSEMSIIFVCMYEALLR